MVKSEGGLTTHSTGARVGDPLIVESGVAQLCARPVNSGVRRCKLELQFLEKSYA